MPRISNNDLAKYIYEILLDYGNKEDSFPIMSAGDIRKKLKEDYDINYSDRRHIYNKIHACARDSPDLRWTYVGNSRGYYLEDWRNAYYHRR